MIDEIRVAENNGYCLFSVKVSYIQKQYRWISTLMEKYLMLEF